jgi:hypothetical protein
VTDAKLPTDVAWTNAIVGQFNDSLSHHIGQWPAIDKDTAELVHATVAWN